MLLSQKLQVARDLVDHTLGRRADAEHCQAPGFDLGPTGVGDHLGGDAEALRHTHERQDLVLSLDLHRDLGLAEPFPAAEELRLGGLGVALGGAQERLVAGEGGVAALGCDLAWRSAKGSACLLDKRRGEGAWVRRLKRRRGQAGREG